MTEHDISLLAALPLFAKTERHTLTEWLKTEEGLLCTLPPGERVDKEVPRCLGILLEGEAEMQSADSGRNVILRVLSAPGIFGAASLFCKGDIPLSRITAKSDCRVLYLPLPAVKALLAADTGFCEAYLGFLAGRVQFLNRKILCFTAGSAERRLALWLISEEGDTVLLPASLTAFADMLDIGRASLYRALDKLVSEGLIARNGREITVLDPQKIIDIYQ